MSPGKKILPMIAAVLLCGCGQEESLKPVGTTVTTTTTKAETSVPTATEVLTMTSETTTQEASSTTSSVTTAVSTTVQTSAKTTTAPSKTASTVTSAKKTVEKVKGKTAKEVLAELSLREKVGQLFITSPSLTDRDLGSDNPYISAFEKVPIGGITVYGSEVVTPDQITRLTKNVQAASKVPMLVALDEEGGRVARIANVSAFPVGKMPSAEAIGKTGDPEQAYAAGRKIGSYMRTYGFNTDFAPVADVNSNPNNTVIGDRSFGSDPGKVSKFVGRFADGLHDSGALTCIKHFPGHGDTNEDTHTSAATVDKTWEQLKQCELIPFTENLDKADMVMVAHITLPKVTGDNTPASLSYEIMTGKLRNELGYKGVIVTDALAMNAVKNYYTPEQAAVMSFKAGADILLIPDSLSRSYNAVLKAVENGEIPVSRLDESVLRILSLKEKYGLLG
jgi:beta-N-acetylhexosaminidase